MARVLNSYQLRALDRRSFLRGAACAGIAAAAQAAPSTELADSTEQTNAAVETSNLGLISAYRAELSAAENQSRNRDLWYDLSHCGRLLVRGCHKPQDGAVMVATAFFAFGKTPDSGHLKGLLQKLGRKYQQRAVLHKPCYGEACLYVLNNVPRGCSIKGHKKLGRFRPDLVAGYLTLITSCDLQLNANWPRRNSEWTDFSLWARRGGLYPKQTLYRLHRDELARPGIQVRELVDLQRSDETFADVIGEFPKLGFAEVGEEYPAARVPQSSVPDRNL